MSIGMKLGIYSIAGAAAGGDSESSTTWFGGRGLWFGGEIGHQDPTLIIDYITISTTGDATDFGDLSINNINLGACSDGTKGLWAGGQLSSGYPNLSNVIEYVTIATTGNTTDFGDLTVARIWNTGCSDGTKGLFGGGYSDWDDWVRTNTIDYVTVATTGDATDFGDLSVARAVAGACSNETRGLWGGGHLNYSTGQDVIDYITMATTGNATDFGDLINDNGYNGACSDGTKGVWGGGWEYPVRVDVIQYVTIATTGNATDFGDLTDGRIAPSSTSGN